MTEPRLDLDSDLVENDCTHELLKLHLLQSGEQQEGRGEIKKNGGGEFKYDVFDIL
jgi:hypothetical protein